MNPLTALRPLLAVCILAVLPSCTGVPGEYGYGGSSGYYDDGSGYSNYSSRPVYNDGYYGGGYSRPYYGSSYYGGSRYYSGSNRYRYDHDHDKDYRRSSSSSSSNKKSSSDNDIRLVKVRDGTRGDIPEGYHSKEWYKARGISLSKNTYETRDGDRRGYTGSSSSSSSKSKSNSSSSSRSSSNSNSKSNSDSKKGGRR